MTKLKYFIVSMKIKRIYFTSTDDFFIKSVIILFAVRCGEVLEWSKRAAC
jgi:hypothetical protein